MAERFNAAVLKPQRAAQGGDERRLRREEPKSSTKRSFVTVFLKAFDFEYFYGEVAEWFNAAVLKTVEGAIPPGVRISPSPP